MRLTPGIRYLLARIHILSIPFVLYYISPLPRLPTFFLSIFALPVGTGLKVFLRRWKDSRDARANGARLMPRLEGKLLGNLDVLWEFLDGYRNGYLGDPFLRVVEKYGPAWDLGILGTDDVVTLCPSHVKEVLATNFDNFEKGADFQYAAHSVLGSGVFNSDGEMWKFHRALTRPHFSRQKIRDFDIFDHHCLEAIEKMKARLHAGYPVNIQDLLSKFTLDTAMEFLFGSSAHTLSSSLPYPYNANPPSSTEDISRTSNPTDISPDEFAEAFAESLEAAAMRIRLGPTWPLYEILHDKTEKPMKIVSRFIDPIVKKALERHSEKVKVGDENATLLDHLVNDTSDPQVLKDETLNILIAGRDTTAATLTYATHFLALYPEIFERLRSEVIGKLGPSKRPTFEEMKDMKYLQAFINETLRLYPVVPFNIRTAIKACLFPPAEPGEKPFFIPAGTGVSYSVYLMHRRKNLWGPDAEEFDPDRFIDERLQKYLLKNPFIFLPFNAGPRICLGQQFAYNEMSFWLCRFIQAFSSLSHARDAVAPECRAPPEWAKAEGRKGKDMIRPYATLTLSIKGGLWINAAEAN